MAKPTFCLTCHLKPTKEREVGRQENKWAEVLRWVLYSPPSTVLNDSFFCFPAETQRSLLLSIIIFGLERTEPFCIMHGSPLNYKYAMTADFPTASIYTLMSALKLSSQSQRDERQIRCGKIRSKSQQVTMCPGQLPRCLTILYN